MEFSQTLIITTATLISAISLPTHADNTLLSHQNVTSIDGRFVADRESPLRVLGMATFGMTSSAVSTPISGWNLGDFTGAYTIAPIENYQRGLSSQWAGSSSVQMYQNVAGCQNHTWSIPNGSAYNLNLSNCQVKYRWSHSDNIRPWASENSRLKVTYDAKIPVAYMENGAVGYIYTSLQVFDPESNKYIWIQPSIYDTRGEPNSESIGWDPMTTSAYATTYYSYAPQRIRYVTKTPDSYWSTGSTWSTWKKYSFTVDQEQLSNIVHDINSSYDIGLSSNFSNYRLIYATIQNEIYWPNGNGHLSMAVRNLTIEQLN